MKLETNVNNLVFWLFSPALIALGALPLFIGHVVVRLLIARMRLRTAVMPANAAPDGLTTQRIRFRKPSWRAPMLRAVSGRS